MEKIAHPEDQRMSTIIAERDNLYKKLTLLYQELEDACSEKLKLITQLKENAKERAGWEREREREREEREERERELRVKIKEVVQRRVGEERRKLKEMEEKWERKLGEEKRKGKEMEEKWERKLGEEEEIRERKSAEDQEIWEQRIWDVRQEYEKRIEEETKRWEVLLEREMREWNIKWQRQLHDEKRRRELLEERIHQILLNRSISNSATGRINLEKMIHLDDTTGNRMPTPDASQSAPASKIAKDASLINSKRKLSNQDIIDLCSDSVSPRIETRVTQAQGPEIFTILDDDESTSQEAATSTTSVSIQARALPPTPTSTSSSQVPIRSNTEGFILSTSRRTQYLSGTSPYRPHNSTTRTGTGTPKSSSSFLPVSISRIILTRLYHSKTMGLRWVSSDHDHKYRLLTPSYEWNPDMPRAPGEPGLLLVTDDLIVKQSPWTVFFKLGDDRVVRWGYAGEYVCKEVGRLMKEEFEAQDDVVKSTWGSNVCARLGEGTLLEMRARIGLRRYLKREPTHDEMREEASKIKKKVSKCVITAQDVVDAIVKGEEHIKVIQMQCVGYDHSRAKNLMNAQEEYEKEQREKKAGRGKEKEAVVESTKARTSKKRIREPPVAQSDDHGNGHEGGGRANDDFDADVDADIYVDDADGETWQSASKRRRLDRPRSSASTRVDEDIEVEAQLLGATDTWWEDDDESGDFYV